MSILTHTNGFVLYDDSSVSNNPSFQLGNWKRTTYNISVNKARGPAEIQLLPGATQTIFSGLRALTIDGTTSMSLSLNTALASTYRLTAVSGTAAGFRTKRAADLTGGNVTVAINNNSVADFTSTVALTGVQVGDTMFIPSVYSGDPASQFAPQNVGYWTVIAVSTNTLSAVRPVGQGFSGVAQSITTLGSNQVVFYSATGVQAGDTVEIAAGFSTVSRKAYIVSAVSWNWIEFVSTEPIPVESNILVGISGILVYSSAKRWVRIEVDQPVVLRFNGGTGDFLKLTPRSNGTDTSIAWFDSWGLFFSLEIVNKSVTQTAKIVISSVE